MGTFTGLCGGLLAATVVAGAFSPAHGEDFYKDKQIKMIIGTGAGGSYDFSGRMIGRHIHRHIAGNPTMVMQNMPGAGSINAANYVYGIAPQDGTVIGGIVQIIPLNHVFDDPGVRFDAGKFQWIGNPSSSVNVYAIWHTAPLKSMDDMFQAPLIFGGTSRTGSGGADIALVNNVLGTKFVLVTGYKGGADIDLAIERGEVHGRAGQSWDGWKLTKPDWIKEGKIKILMQMGLARDKDLKDVPLMTELAKTEEQKMILGLFSDSVALGRPLVFGPGVPAERVKMLRDAFRMTMSDPEFIAEAQKAGYEVSPIYGEDLQGIVARMLATPAPVIAKAHEAMSFSGEERTTAQ
jgi:tripartite-type tricarboxylate transporter receptor subunit TctC